MLTTGPGGNMAVRRDIARDLGGFREDLGWGARRVPREEVEFFSRLFAAGHALRYSPGARVNHHVQPPHVTLEYYLRWQEGSGRASVLMKPPAGPFDRLGKAGTALRHRLRCWWRARRATDEIVRVEQQCKGAYARGRQLELMGR